MLNLIISFIFLLVQVNDSEKEYSGKVSNVSNYRLHNYHYLYDLWEPFTYTCEPFISPEDIIKYKIRTIVVEEYWNNDTSEKMIHEFSFDSLGRMASYDNNLMRQIMDGYSEIYDTLDDGRPKYSLERYNWDTFRKNEILYDKRGLYIGEKAGSDTVNKDMLIFDDKGNLIKSHGFSVNDCGKFVQYCLENTDTINNEMLFHYDSLCRMIFMKQPSNEDSVCWGKYFEYDGLGRIQYYYLLKGPCDSLTMALINGEMPNGSEKYEPIYYDNNLPREIIALKLPEGVWKSKFIYTFY